MPLKSTQVDVKHTQTHSYEGKSLNLCLRVWGEEKGAFMAAGPLYGRLVLSYNLGEGIWMGGPYGLVGHIGILRGELKRVGTKERPESLLGILNEPVSERMKECLGMKAPPAKEARLSETRDSVKVSAKENPRGKLKEEQHEHVRGSHCPNIILEGGHVHVKTQKSPWCGVSTTGLRKEASMKKIIEPTFAHMKTERISMPQKGPESDQTQIFRYVGWEGRQFGAMKDK